MLQWSKQLTLKAARPSVRTHCKVHSRLSCKTWIRSDITSTWSTNTNNCVSYSFIHVLLLHESSAVAQQLTEAACLIESPSVSLPRLTASLWPAVKPSSKIGHILWYMWLLSWSTVAIRLIEHMIYRIIEKPRGWLWEVSKNSRNFTGQPCHGWSISC